MKTKKCGAPRGVAIQGFTLFELLVVIAIITTLAALMLPAHAKAKQATQRSQCVENLGQIGMAFKVWEGNHGDKYSMAVSTAFGGAMETLYSIKNSSSAGYGGATTVFQVMSNEMNTPRIAYCPSDLSPAADGSTIVTAALTWGAFTNINLSYFVEGDATDLYPKMILTGDRNIGHIGAVSGIAPATSMDMMRNATSVGGYADSVNEGITGAGVKPLPWEWTDLDLHQDVGNLGMADGSVQQSSLKSLANSITDTMNARPGRGLQHIVIDMP